MTTPQELMYDIKAYQDQTNQVALHLADFQAPVFEPTLVEYPPLSPAELGFVRSISFLWVLYHDANRVNVRFIRSRFELYGLDSSGDHKRHVETVYSMRTYFQHYLTSSASDDRRTLRDCEDWFRQNCATPVPGTPTQWAKCLIAILSEARLFMYAVLTCLRRIEGDDSRDTIVKDWNNRRKRSHSRQEFDDLIDVTAKDMGRPVFDAKQLRRRYYDIWVHDLELIPGDYDFAVEARRRIEHAILSESEPLLSVTGDDIMRELVLPPGPDIERMLKEARTLCAAKPHSREELLEKLGRRIRESTS